MAICNILLSFGYFLWPIGRFCGHVFTVFVCCTKKNLATLGFVRFYKNVCSTTLIIFAFIDMAAKSESEKQSTHEHHLTSGVNVMITILGEIFGVFLENQRYDEFF
jgi:hypothetical protein